MKLGFWNRLAIVATVSAMIAFPTWYVWSGNDELGRIRQVHHEHCLLLAQDSANPIEAQNRCFDLLIDPDQYWYGWNEWLEGILPTLTVCIVIYLIIFGIVATARWVWRGRAPENTEME